LQQNVARRGRREARQTASNKASGLPCLRRACILRVAPTLGVASFEKSGTHAMTTEGPSKWEEIRADWGRRLLKEYSNGLGKTPDFSNDAPQRIKWYTKAIEEYPKQSWAILNRWEIEVEGKKYTDFPKDPHDQALIANKAFQDADMLWYQC